MATSRALLAFSFVSLALCLVDCGGNVGCEDCAEPVPTGLAVIAPDQLAIASCAPAQVVKLDGNTPVRPTKAGRLALDGDVDWYADASCAVPASRLRVEVGSRGAVAYFRAAASGAARARVSADGPTGGETSVNVRAAGGTATALKVAGARYVDTGSCSPVWVAAADASGGPATLATSVNVALSAAGARFFTNDTCTSALETVQLSGGHESVIAFAQFGLPGDIELSASASGLAPGKLGVDVEGDLQIRLAVTPDSELLEVSAGSCTAFDIGVVDLAGAPLAVTSMDVALSAVDAEVFSNPTCSSAISSTTIRGTTPSTVHVRATRAGTATFNVTLANSQSRTVTLSVRAAAATALQLLGSKRLSQNGCYRYFVQRSDAFGNPVKGDAITVGLTAVGLAIFGDAACATTAASVAVTANTSGATIFVRGATIANAVTMTAALAGLASGVATVDVVSPATALTLQVDATGVAGTCLAARVRTVDAGGVATDPLVAETVTIDTGAADLVVYADAACGSPVSSVVVPALTSLANVYLRGTIADDYSLAVSGDHLTAPAARAFSILAGPPSTVVVVGVGRLNLGSCSRFELALRDEFANPASSPLALAVDVPMPTRGNTYASGACDSPSSTVTFPANTATTEVYYRGESFGADRLVATVPGFDEAGVDIDVVFFMSDVQASVADAPIVYSLALDPLDSDIVWVQTYNGMVWRSGDAGTSWRTMCKTPTPNPDYGVGLFVSPGVDGTAYTNTNHANAVYRVDDLAGASCPSIVNGLSTVYAYSVTVGITVDSTGRLFAWNGSGSDTVLHTSANYGATWELLYDDTQSTAYMGFMANHPTNPLIKVVDRAFAGANDGLYRTVDGGVTWTFVTADGFDDSQRNIKFDPGHPGYVYKAGRSSDNDGATWAANAGYNGLSLSWGLDGSGAAYRFNVSTTASTVIERAPDARTPVWAALASGVPQPFIDAKTRMSVFSDGQVIAVRANGLAYRTVDAGVAFDRVPSPGSIADYTLTIAAASDSDGYAIGNDVWLALATHDGGESWQVGGAGGGTRRPVIHVNPSFPDSVYVRAEEYNSTYDSHVIASQDGFATVRLNDYGSVNCWATAGAVSLADPLVFMTIGGSCQRTIDGGVSYQSRTCPNAPFVWYPSPNGWISPIDRDVMWYAGQNSSQGLWQVSWLDGSIVNLTGRTGIAPAGIEMYHDGVGYVVRLVSSNGALVSSTDLTTSFGVPSTASAEGTCTNRYIVSLPGQPDSVAHACIGRDTVVVSRNGGTLWTRVPVTGCGVRQLALFDDVLVVSCGNGRQRTLSY